MAAGSLGDEPIRFLPEVLAVERRRLAVGGLQTIAVLKNHLWTALDEQHLLAVCGLCGASP